SSGGDDGGATTCEDTDACNNGETGDCEFVNVGWGNLQWPLSTSVEAGSDSEGIYGQVYVDGVSGSANSESGIVAELGYGTDGSTPDDTWTWVSTSLNGTSGDNDEFGGTLNIADANTYSYSYRYRYDSSCWYYASETGTITVNALITYDVTFSVDMSVEGVTGDIKVRTSTVDGEYNPSDWFVMNDNGDDTYSYTLSLATGVTYGYNFNDSNGSGYESGDALGDCAGGTYGNDRFVTP
ncbi:uncharacterized protein METZ01_LOCUS489562, partial [marine metagenome]